jgi:hypothetical protein
MRAVLLMAPLVAVLYWRFSWWMAPLFWAVQIYVETPVVLMLHNTMHRPFFRKHRWLNRALPYAMNGLFGIPTGFMEHHVAMHHVENNLADDCSSTMLSTRQPLSRAALRRAVPVFSTSTSGGTYTPEAEGAGPAGNLQRSGARRDRSALSGALAGDIGRLRDTLRGGSLPDDARQSASTRSSIPRGQATASSTASPASTQRTTLLQRRYHIGHHLKQNRHWTELLGDFWRTRTLPGRGLRGVRWDRLLHGDGGAGPAPLRLARRALSFAGDDRTDAEVIAF